MTLRQEHVRYKQSGVTGMLYSGTRADLEGERKAVEDYIAVLRRDPYLNSTGGADALRPKIQQLTRVRSRFSNAINRARENPDQVYAVFVPTDETKAPTYDTRSAFMAVVEAAPTNQSYEKVQPTLDVLSGGLDKESSNHTHYVGDNLTHFYNAPNRIPADVVYDNSYSFLRDTTGATESEADMAGPSPSTLNVRRLILNDDQVAALQDADSAELVDKLGAHLGTAVLVLKGCLPAAVQTVEVGMYYGYDGGYEYTVEADISDEYVLLKRDDGTERPELKSKILEDIRSGRATVFEDEDDSE